MLTLLGSIFGFIASFAPSLISILKDKQDKKHELEIMDRQLKLQELSGQQQLNEIQMQSDAQQNISAYSFANQTSKIAWVDAVTSLVRPVITYSFFALFGLVKLSTLFYFIFHRNHDLLSSIILIWDEPTSIMFATVLSFWFGGRQSQKILSHA